MTDKEIDYYLLEVEKGNKRYGIYLKNHIEDLAKEGNKLYKQLQQKENIIKEVREYIENNWISKKDADYYRCDDAELDIEISDIAVLFDILDKGE